jgi:hypothetical protein
MQRTDDLQNTTSSSIKEKVIISKIEPRVPQSRGEVAAQEQMRILRQAITAGKGEPRVPQSRGEVAAQEQMRILRQAMTY